VDGRPTAAVSLGDSYIAGEAGRWKGNASVSTPGFNGTDRAWRPDGTTDPSRVYGNTAGGCDRSDVAPIISADLHVQRSINLACSGARTVNVLRASAGGASFKGEAPQDDQLYDVARQNRVRLIALSIGGNDLGFGNIVNSCVLAYLFASTPCSTAMDSYVKVQLPIVQQRVGNVVDDVRATMRAAGYPDRSYRLILESYPSPLASSIRYDSVARRFYGCPISDVDATWARTTVVPALSGVIKAVAKSHDVQYLDLGDAFRGHELCAPTDQQSTGTPRGATSEWIRFIDLFGQGSGGESLHPNAYGQRALGHCLAWAAYLRHDLACHGVPRMPTWAVYPTPI
jgi:hypothetical protein